MSTYKNLLRWVIPIGFLMWLIFYITSCSNKLNIPPKVGQEYTIYGCSSCDDFQTFSTIYEDNPFYTTQIRVSEVRKDYVKYQCVYTKIYYTLSIWKFNSRIKTYNDEN